MALKYASKALKENREICLEAGKQYVLSESKKPKYFEITGEILSDFDYDCSNELLMNFKKSIDYNTAKQIHEENKESNDQNHKYLDQDKSSALFRDILEIQQI